MESKKYPYQKEWKEYRRKQTILGLIFLGLIPFMVLIFPFLHNFPKSYDIGGVNIGIIFFILYLAIIGVCFLRLFYLICPKCGKSFNSNKWQRYNFSDKCQYCKLVKYEGSDIESW